MKRLSVMLLLVSAACAGTETGNPSFRGELSYNTHSSDSVAVALAALAGPDQSEVRVDAAWLVLDDAHFVGAESCEPDAQAEGHVKGLGVGDHATEEAPTTGFQLDFGDYCALQLPFRRAVDAELPAEAPAALAGHSILVQGELSDGTAFEIASAQERIFLIGAAQTHLHLGPDRSTLLVGFDVAVWFDGLDLSQAAPGDAGVVRISESEHPDLLAAFEANLAAGIALYEDPELSGVVAQDAEPLATAE